MPVNNLMIKVNEVRSENEEVRVMNKLNIFY